MKEWRVIVQEKEVENKSMKIEADDRTQTKEEEDEVVVIGRRVSLIKALQVHRTCLCIK